MKLPQIFALHPDISTAVDLLHRLDRTHFDQRLRVSVKAGIPALPYRAGNTARIFGQIPAVGYVPGQRCILIHPHVLNRNPPRFVLRYLIHHGLGEARRDQQGHTSRCQHALCPVMAYGNRVNRWLMTEGFPPVHPDAISTGMSTTLAGREPATATVNTDFIEWSVPPLSGMIVEHDETDRSAEAQFAPCNSLATVPQDSSPNNEVIRDAS
jgi:hypothetical protein